MRYTLTDVTAGCRRVSLKNKNKKDEVTAEENLTCVTARVDGTAI